MTDNRLTDTLGPLLLDSYRVGRSRGAADCQYNDTRFAENPYDPELQPHAHRGWSDAWQWVRAQLDRRRFP